MAIINYTNIAVNIAGYSSLYVSNANFSFRVPMEPIRSLGAKKSINDIANGPVEGNLNIEYIITSNDPGKAIFESIINNPQNYQGNSVTIGGKTFPNAYLNSHTLSAEPNSIVNGSLSFTVFGEGGGQMTPSNPEFNNNVSVAHGAASTIVSNAISFDYTATVDWEPIYILNSSNVNEIIFRGAQQVLNIRGLNLGKAIKTCPDVEGIVNINIGAICEPSSLVNIMITGAKIQSSESTISAGGFVEGSYELVKNY
jgi:hypothetical protein